MSKKPEVDVRVAKIRTAVETLDLGVKDGKRALWLAFPPKERKVYQNLRDAFVAEKYSAPDASRMAALEIAQAWEDGEASASPLLGSLSSASGSVVSAGLKKLMMAVREREKAAKGRVGLARCIEWVSSNILFDLEDLEVEHVPSVRALGLWHWAHRNQHQNESDYRKTFEGRIIPSSGLKEAEEAGWFDSGAPIDDIMLRIQDAGSACPLRSPVDDVSVRHLQTPVQLGDDHKPAGGVHELPEPVVEGRGDDGSGREGGSDSDSNAGAGVGDQAEGGSDGALAGGVRADERPGTDDSGPTAAGAAGEPDRPINEHLAAVFEHACGNGDSAEG